MSHRYKYLALFFALLAVGIYCHLSTNPVALKEATPVARLPYIDPDYTNIVIPPNIAPLNFMIKEPGRGYYVNIYTTEGKNIEIFSRSPKIIIPQGRWKKMVNSNRGQELHFDVYAKNENGQWLRFQTITNRIAREDIDGFLVYRLMAPLYILWKKLGIYQRNLQNYDESLIFHNRAASRACINCHCFYHNNPDKMILHLRGGPGTSMLLAQRGAVVKVDTRTEFNQSPAAYPSWHPNGKLLAFSVNTVKQFFHAVGENRDVFDQASDLILYQIESNTVTTSPQISRPDRMETYPMWSADGKYLYFCSAPALGSDFSLYKHEYKKVQYDLMRIPYDPETETWGEPETVLSAAETGLSITHPRISPDGRFLLFCMADYGNFPVYRSNSDLYLMDLKTRQYQRLDINSDRSDSYHCWSSNSRWFVFSSKRRDGLLARPYFSYIDENGKVYKPFLLPQKDPAFYDTYLRTYNVPELISEPIRVRPQVLAGAAMNKRKTLKAKLDPGVEPRVSPTIEKPVWQPAPQ
ncbi:MAG: hypothetical protein ONB05_05710 [candidate division KSB1 bacterium]|nr:hypothetical protein [candidate division KSB1 bacterium]